MWFPYCLGVLAACEAPLWETKDNGRKYRLRHHSHFMVQHRGIAAERMMSQGDVRIAQMERQAVGLQRMRDQIRQDMEQRKGRAIKRQREAVGSSKLYTTISTGYSLKTSLRAEKYLSKSGGCARRRLIP